MTPEDFHHALGQIGGQLTRVIAQNEQQIEQLKTLDAKIDGVRSSLSAKIDTEVGKIGTRMDGIDTRLRAVETDGAKRSAQVGLASGGVAAVAVALAIKAGEMLLKIKGGP
jgi:hypothetical protein